MKKFIDVGQLTININTISCIVDPSCLKNSEIDIDDKYKCRIYFCCGSTEKTADSTYSRKEIMDKIENVSRKKRKK